jgi:glycine/D-amino acid oxidase-like deaminating enzyme
LAETDILVVGGGPSGIMAALAAAQDGLKVALVEKHAYVGGNLTIGLPVLGFLSQKGRQIIAGLPQKLIDRLRAINAAGEHQPCPLHVSLTLIDPEAVKSVALEMLAESGIEIMLNSVCEGVVMEGDRIGGIVTGNKAISAKVIIDCTGDGDVAFRAGVPCDKGDAHGGMQPATLMFRMDGVDTEKLRQSICSGPETYDVDYIPPDYFCRNRRFIVVGLRKLMRKAQEAGLSIPTERTILITGLREGEVWVNMTRVKGIDGTDPRSVSAGETKAREQIEDIRRYLIRFVPGFEKAYLAQTAPFLGIRETRRIVGRYVMTRDDILSCRRFDDAVAVGSYPIDLHRPNDDGCTLEWCGDCYDIPYRALLPQGVENLLVAGRCISTTHEAMAAIRVMSTCMAMGEAAGRAAKMASREGISPSDIDTRKLREDLIAGGAFLRT